MSFEKILSDLINGIISPQEAYDAIQDKDKLKKINYYAHFNDISREPLGDSELQELQAIVEILQILYTSNVDSPVSDSEYDSLQELLVDMGIPRLTGSVEINENSKVAHSYTNLRGTLSKVYYLTSDERRVNKSRKYLDEWIKDTEALYKKNTGKDIDLNSVLIICQPKFDGVSCILESGDKPLWITRGDTDNNLASDVSHIMNIFNDVYAKDNYGCKFECMYSEESKDKINELIREHPYHNSRQIVTSILNSNEADFKSEYLYPIPLREFRPGDKVEHIHPDLVEKFPTLICAFGDRELIREFANDNRYVVYNGMHFRTDGVVMTILDDDIKLALGRENNINKFETAYKFTEETAKSKVLRVEFSVSSFGIVTPVLVVNDVILKGNTVNHISLSNKERFDELSLSYGDEVKILYDIIPYALVDDTCRRMPNGRKIEFTPICPMCHEPLDLNVVQVRCTNPDCPSTIIGRVLNYCQVLRIENIGYQTLETLYVMGLLKHGIASLYKLKKKTYEVEELEGFGKIKTKKIVAEIEAKRRVKDYEFFGAIGIKGLSVKTFQWIFRSLPLSEFMDLLKLQNFDLMKAKILQIKGIAEKKADILIIYLKDKNARKDLSRILEQVRLIETYSTETSNKGIIVFSGCRPSKDIFEILSSRGYEISASWTKKAKYLVVPNMDFTSSKVDNARQIGVPIIPIREATTRIM